MKIMQENCEVVAMLGSSANLHNMRMFLTADASLAVEPLYPQVKSLVTALYVENTFSFWRAFLYLYIKATRCMYVCLKPIS